MDLEKELKIPYLGIMHTSKRTHNMHSLEPPVCKSRGRVCTDRKHPAHWKLFLCSGADGRM